MCDQNTNATQDTLPRLCLQIMLADRCNIILQTSSIQINNKLFDFINTYVCGGQSIAQLHSKIFNTAKTLQNNLHGDNLIQAV